jgi:hypothetical protein
LLNLYYSAIRWFDFFPILIWIEMFLQLHVFSGHWQFEAVEFFQGERWSHEAAGKLFPIGTDPVFDPDAPDPLVVVGILEHDDVASHALEPRVVHPFLEVVPQVNVLGFEQPPEVLLFEVHQVVGDDAEVDVLVPRQYGFVPESAEQRAVAEDMVDALGLKNAVGAACDFEQRFQLLCRVVAALDGVMVPLVVAPPVPYLQQYHKDEEHKGTS